MTTARNVGEPTIERNKQCDSSVGSPSLNFADVGGQDGVVHSTVEHFSSRRHVAEDFTFSKDSASKGGRKEIQSLDGVVDVGQSEN